MRILSAVYVADDGIKKELILRDITSFIYEDQLKGKLYCPSENCKARISYSRGKKAHFRTWRMDEHSNECIFRFDRIALNTGVNTTETINVEIPYSRKQKALQEAFRIMNLSEEERAAQSSNTDSKPRSRERVITRSKKSVTGMQMVLFDGEEYDHQLLKPRTYIWKRLVDEITLKDIGEIRLVMGNVVSVRKIGEVAELVVEHNNQSIKVVFEEAFIAERLNSSYLNKFWTIERLMKETGNVQFTGIGDIRKKSVVEVPELVIYHGSDFKVNNIDMSSLAVQFVRRNFEEEQDSS
ncbi:hypothetical protein [Sporosarcina cascadiensis]|uniref:hypothetical protein n=1 Tax=Sporosarcina cascadiensis TaxID=2660747 RepID=UPI00129BF666|nr:hypothetical protein [Sporosarcina cascadiensis]